MQQSVDIGKIKYEEKKKRNLKKMSRVDNSLKEITMRLNCGPGDLETKMKKVIGFLEEGHMVRMTVRLYGREKGKPQIAADLLNRLVETISSSGKLSNGPPKANGFNVSVTLAPTPSSSQKATAKRKKIVEG
jgi:translation initiation factor IF-3